MKKTILFALMAVGLTVSFFVGISVSQEQGAVIPTPKRITIITDSLTAESLEGLKQLIPLFEDRFSKTQRLRNELKQLFEQRLQSMNDEELTARKADLQKELRENWAESKLREAKKLRQQAKEILQDIVKTYPKSQAAEQARKMLETPTLPTKANLLGIQLK